MTATLTDEKSTGTRIVFMASRMNCDTCFRSAEPPDDSLSVFRFPLSVGRTENGQRKTDNVLGIIRSWPGAVPCQQRLGYAAQRGFLDFASGGARDVVLGDDEQVARHFVAGQRLATELAQLAGRALLVWAQHHQCGDVLAAHRIGDA